jgi:hypothetical protein
MYQFLVETLPQVSAKHCKYFDLIVDWKPYKPITANLIQDFRG